MLAARGGMYLQMEDEQAAETIQSQSPYRHGLDRKESRTPCGDEDIYEPERRLFYE